MIATLDDAAGAVGVGPGTLYRHFPTRAAVMKRWQLKHDAAQRRRLLSVVIDGPHNRRSDNAVPAAQSACCKSALQGATRNGGPQGCQWARPSNES